jgi:hypothetical protein
LGIPFAFLTFGVYIYSIEVVRWNTVYTLANNQQVYLFHRSLHHLFPTQEVVLNLSVFVDVDWERNGLLERLGCSRGMVGLEKGGGRTLSLEYLPWRDISEPVLRFAASTLGQTIPLGYDVGLFWLDMLERVTRFQNKLGDLWRGAEASWAWMDPPVILPGAGRELNLGWATAQRPQREKLDLVYKPEKAWYLSSGIWQAWKAYLVFLAAHAGDRDGAFQAGLEALHRLAQEQGDKFIPALQVWEKESLSPRSEDWVGLYLPALYTVMSRWGSFTTPRLFTEEVDQVRAQARNLGFNA